MTSKNGVPVAQLLAARPDLHLSRNQLITLDWLARTGSTATNREIADGNGLPIKSVRRAITELRRKGLISETLGDRRVILCPGA